VVDGWVGAKLATRLGKNKAEGAELDLGGDRGGDRDLHVVQAPRRISFVSTRADRGALLALAATPGVIGVENCWSVTLSSERRVCVGISAASLVSIATLPAGLPARARMTGPCRRRHRTSAASQVS